jgi:hypothetical protein
MSESDYDEEEIESLPAPAPADRFGDALALCRIANNKTIATALKKMRRINRQIADAEAKVIAVQDQAEQMQAALAERQAAIDAREAAIARRETEFEVSLHEAHATLRASHDNLSEVDRRIRFRIASSGGLLHGFNEQLQELPSWQQIKQMVPGLPDDPPPLVEREVVSHPRIDALSDTFDDPNADRHGNVFLGTLTRSVSHKATSQ